MQNLGMAFHLITKEFAVARLLEPEDLLSNDASDARSVAIYLIELRAAVEMDRRRRNKPTFEIRTAAMVSVGIVMCPVDSYIFFCSKYANIIVNENKLFRSLELP